MHLFFEKNKMEQKKFKFTKKIIDWLTDHTTKKIEKNQKLQTATELALFLFVAIPLPGTGAWTGALIANFLKLWTQSSSN